MSEIRSKTIWTLWIDNKDAHPPQKGLIDACVVIMAVKCPNWEVQLVNLRNLDYFLDLKDLGDLPEDVIVHADETASVAIQDLLAQSVNLAHIKDLVMCALLEKYGGAWGDASCVLTQDVDEWIQEPGEKINAFELPQWSNDGYKYVENYFMTSPKGSLLMHNMRNELAANILATDTYADRIGPYVMGRICNLPPPFDKSKKYLTMHLAFHKVALDMGIKLTDVIVFHDGNEGPFFCKPAAQKEVGKFEERKEYFVDVPPFMSAVLTYNESKKRVDAVVDAMKTRKFIKLTAGDRAFVLKDLATCKGVDLNDKDSVVAAAPEGSPLRSFLSCALPTRKRTH